MAFNINTFRGNLLGGGARPNLFQVSFANPVDPAGDTFVPFMVQSTVIPSSEVSTVTLNYFGRAVKYAGIRTFPTWTTTVINDENFRVRSALENWSDAINGHASNRRDTAFVNPGSYKTDAFVTQFGKDGVVLRNYKFVGIWPSVISDIALDWGTDAIETFTVTWEYDHWEAGQGGSVGQLTSPEVGVAT